MVITGRGSNSFKYKKCPAGNVIPNMLQYLFCEVADPGTISLQSGPKIFLKVVYSGAK